MAGVAGWSDALLCGCPDGVLTAQLHGTHVVLSILPLALVWIETASEVFPVEQGYTHNAFQGRFVPRRRLLQPQRLLLEGFVGERIWRAALTTGVKVKRLG